MVESHARAFIHLLTAVNTDQYARQRADNMEIGRAAGREAVRLLGGAGKAAGLIYEICGGLATPPAQERRDGFHEIVEAEPGISVIGGLDADWKKDRAQTITQDALKTHPDIKLIYAHNDPMAHGAYLAAKAAGRADQIMFLGIDANPDEGQRWVRAGESPAPFAYPTPGEKGLEVALLSSRASRSRNATPCQPVSLPRNPWNAAATRWIELSDPVASAWPGRGTEPFHDSS